MRFIRLFTSFGIFRLGLGIGVVWSVAASSASASSVSSVWPDRVRSEPVADLRWAVRTVREPLGALRVQSAGTGRGAVAAYQLVDLVGEHLEAVSAVQVTFFDSRSRGWDTFDARVLSVGAQKVRVLLPDLESPIDGSVMISAYDARDPAGVVLVGQARVALESVAPDLFQVPEGRVFPLPSTAERFLVSLFATGAIPVRCDSRWHASLYVAAVPEGASAVSVAFKEFRLSRFQDAPGHPGLQLLEADLTDAAREAGAGGELRVFLRVQGCPELPPSSLGGAWAKWSDSEDVVIPLGRE